MRGIPILDAISSILSCEKLPPGGKEMPVSRKPAPRDCVTEAADIERDILVGEGVAASLPGHCVILDSKETSGAPDFWMRSIWTNASAFNPAKTAIDGSKLKYEAITLHGSTLDFLPDGDAFGMGVADADEFVDSGVQLEIREQPGRQAACSELALLMFAAKAGVAPAVIAAFFGKREVGPRPLMVLSQLSTFSLGTMLSAYAATPAGAEREHMRVSLFASLPLVFAKLKELSREDVRVVKLNASPKNVVFCPKLAESTEGWRLQGVGYQPVSDSLVDGLPMLIDYNPTWVCRLRSDAHSPQLSYVMHGLLLTAFARAEHGAAASGVIVEALLAKDDPTGFVKALDEVQAASTNASGFLSAMAATAELRETPDVSKAIAECVCNLDSVVRKSVSVRAGTLEADAGTRLFGKVVALVSGLAEPDTCVFAAADASELLAEAEQLAAMRAVKMVRRRRLAAGCETDD